MKQKNVYALAGLVALTAIAFAFMRASLQSKHLKLAAAGRKLSDPEVTAALAEGWKADLLCYALPLATFLCLWAAFKVEWDKSWKLWAVVLSVLFFVAFGIGNFLPIDS
jgi:hypothetical protein